jgi:prepilin signal peptidase PulO-like enzyme (type II secretory pathway)
MDLLPLLLTVGVLTGLAGGLRSRWDSRAVQSAGPWLLTLLSAAGVALLVGALTADRNSPSAALSAAAAAWLAVLAASTDLGSRKIPREACHAAAAVGLIAAGTAADMLGWLNAAVAAVALVALPWVARAATRQGLGLGDIRLLWAFTATLGWWLDPAVLTYALIGACLLQLGVRVVARLVRRGRAVAPVQSLLPEPVAAGSVANEHTVDAAPHREQAGRGRQAQRTPDSPAGRRAGEMPFGPALAGAYLTVLLYGPVGQAWSSLCGG